MANSSTISPNKKRRHNHNNSFSMLEEYDTEPPSSRINPYPNRKVYDIIFKKNLKSFNSKKHSTGDSEGEGAQEASINAQKNNIFKLMID